MEYDVSLAVDRKSNDVSEVAPNAAAAPSAQAAPPKPVEEGYRTVGDFTSAAPVMQARQVDVFYGDNHAIQKVSLDIGRNEVIALIGPSGCGKSTFIRCLNRMNDTIESARITGNITLDGENIYSRQMDVVMLRARVGMVFQKPNPFPKSVYDNVAYGPRIHGLARDRGELDEMVQTSLERAGLWTEVKDRLEEPGTGLSGGQQQRRPRKPRRRSPSRKAIAPSATSRRRRPSCRRARWMSFTAKITRSRESASTSAATRSSR